MWIECGRTKIRKSNTATVGGLFHFKRNVAYWPETDVLNCQTNV